MTQHCITWRFIARSISAGVPVMLLYVLESKGSSPGRQGFFMAATAEGEMEGSIGGGIMEHKFVELAKEKLKSVNHKSGSGSIKRQIHDKFSSKEQSGMICSGEQTILIYEVKESDQEAIRNIVESLEQNKNGTLQLSPLGIAFNNEVPVTDYEYVFQSSTQWSYWEKTGYKNRLFIIGGGHCSLALSKLMRSMDFYITVFDDRKNLKTMVQNTAAHEKHFIDGYSELKELVPPGKNHYVVIMTFGYRTDDIATWALMGKDYRYLGLLGSTSKTKKMLDEYRRSGIKDEWLQRVHAPVGLQIKSQTPEEIAISIAAAIIQEKNKES
jgi:xanthine dehydrogenase accessory factor